MTTTTIVDTGTPPTLPTPWTAPTVDYRETLTPHRDLPDTGVSGLLLPSAGLCVVVGLVLAVVARKRRRKRYSVVKGAIQPKPTQRCWVVCDRTTPDVPVCMYMNKHAARNRAAVLNADVPSLADSKGWH